MKLVTALLLCSCSLSVLGDAEEDCRRIEAAISSIGVRCGGHALSEAVLRCDELLTAGMTSEDAAACEAWAAQVSCEEAWPVPEACRFGGVRF